jgi:hypothetical protein
MSRPGDLSERELLVLCSIPNAPDVEGLSKLTKLPPATLGKEIATLQIKGYIADDGTLSKKGLEAIKG